MLPKKPVRKGRGVHEDQKNVQLRNMRFACVAVAGNIKLTATKPVSMSMEILYWQAEKFDDHRSDIHKDGKVFSDGMC
jgi:hypothetical protein